jgi:surface polysaccharide O-acyltransferase-like enzyme
MMTSVQGFSQVSQNTLSSRLLLAYFAEILPFQMPLLFLIAGYSAAVSLQKRSINTYLKERIKRLVIPLISYMVFLAPIQTYFWPNYQGERSLTDFWMNYFPKFFSRSLFAEKPPWDHLWFIAYLLVINLLFLAWLLVFKNPQNKQKFALITNLLSTPVGIFLPIIIFTAIVAGLGSIWPLFIAETHGGLYQDWSYVTYNLFAFILGYMMYYQEAISRAIDQQFWFWVALAVISAVIRLAILASKPDSYEVNNYGQYLIFSGISGVHTWSSIALILALAHRFLNYKNEFLAYMSQASLGFYILHLPFTVVIGYYLTKIGLGVIPEFTVLVILTFAATILTYEFLVKPYLLPSLLLGIKRNN